MGRQIPGQRSARRSQSAGQSARSRPPRQRSLLGGQLLEPRLALAVAALATSEPISGITTPAIQLARVDTAAAASVPASSLSVAPQARAAGLPSASPATVTASPALSLSFGAVNFDQDHTVSGSYHAAATPSGAVGLTQVVSVAGGTIQSYSKTGTQLFSISLAQFYAPLGAIGNRLSDPKVIYDSQSDRFVVVALERQDTALGDAVNSSRLLVAVSTSGDSTAGWNFQAINAQLTINGTSTWADYPGVAVDPQAVYITVNQYAVGAAGAYEGSRLWIVNKNPLYTGGTSTAAVYDPFAGAGVTQETTMTPALIYTPGGVGGSVATYLVSSGWTAGNTDFLSVIRVGNPLSAPTFTNQFINLGDIDNTSVSIPSAPQSGTIRTLAIGDGRVQSVFWRDNRLFAANVVVPSTGSDAGQATVHWYELSTSTPTSVSLVDQGNVGGEDIAAGAYTFDPSVSADAFGNIAIGFSASAATIFPGAYYTVHQSTDAASTVESSVALAVGQDYFHRALGGSADRWGPYSSVSIDPTTDVTFWAYNQYSLARGATLAQYPGEDGRWGTSWGRFRIVATQSVINTGGPYTINTGDSLTITSTLLHGPDDGALYFWNLPGSVFVDLTGKPTISWSYLTSAGISAPGTYTISVQVYNHQSILFASNSTTLIVVDTPPVLDFEQGGPALHGQTTEFFLAATSVSPFEQQANFTYAIKWGDGSVTQTVIGPANTAIAHTFLRAGTYTVTATATDNAGGISNLETIQVVVTTAIVFTDSDNPALTDLLWCGTAGADQVRFDQLDATTIRVTTLLENLQPVNIVQTFMGVTGRVYALAGAGADTIDATGLTTTQATLDGQGGSNTLLGGAAGDVLIGGSNGGEGKQGNNTIIAGNGNNTIFGNDSVGAEGATGGNNLIVGGAGSDTIYGAFGSVQNSAGASTGGEGGQNLIVGGGGADTIYASQQIDGAEGGHGSILVAGTTNLSQAALASVLAEWTSNDTYATKVAAISGIGSGGANGANYLRPGVTVMNDHSVDQLFSDSKGQLNWLLFTVAEDMAMRVKSGETESNLP